MLCALIIIHEAHHLYIPTTRSRSNLYKLRILHTADRSTKKKKTLQKHAATIKLLQQSSAFDASRNREITITGDETPTQLLNVEKLRDTSRVMAKSFYLPICTVKALATRHRDYRRRAPLREARKKKG